MTDLVRFNFDGDPLEVVSTPDGECRGVLATLCAPLEIKDSWEQARKLKKLRWARTVKITVRENGLTREVLCIHLRSIAGWLFTLNPGKVAPHLREKLDRYQTACADALADRFMGPRLDPAVLGRIDRLEADLRSKSEEAAQRAEEIEALKLRVELLDPDNAGVIGKERAETFILSPLREAARVRCAAHEDFAQKTYRSFLRVFENEVRQHVDYPQGRALRWSELEILRLGRAHQKARSILERERAEQKRVIGEMKAKLEQLELPLPH